MRRRFRKPVAITALIVISVGGIGLVMWSAGDREREENKGIESLVASVRLASSSEDLAVKRLIEIGTPAVPHLIRELRRTRSRFRRDPSYRKFHAALPASVRERFPHPLGQEDFFKCAAIAYTLGGIGPTAHTAVPYLKDATQDSDPSIRLFATQALGDIGPAAKSALPAMVKAFGNTNDYHSRRATLRSFALIGEADPLAIAIAKQFLDDTNSSLRIYSRLGLWRMEPSAANSLYVSKCLSSDDRVIRSITASELGQMGSVAQPFLSTLRRMPDNEDADFRQVIDKAISLIE